jgi:SRSO17 transposase
MQTHVVPKASPATLPELETYLAPFAPLFRRSTSRASVERYLTGLLTDLPRKNCDTIAAAVAGTSTERLQHLLTDATWDPQALDQQRVTALVAQSPPQGLLVLDDTRLPKQGRRSVGVARQYSGPLGKVANCQVVVSAHYVADEPTSRAPVHWPVTARLYLPEAWATDPARRSAVHVPMEVALQTKPALALALVDQARAWGVPFACVVADAGYGDNSTFVQGLDARQVAYVVGVSSSFGVRLPADTPLHRLAEVAHSRWPIEQFYEDAKGACGLDHYQGRRWDGLHRHLALVMLAYSFLACQRWPPADPAGFSPSGARPSFPAIHRQVLVWLFQDVVLWLIATNQITQFRPRRI